MSAPANGWTESVKPSDPRLARSALKIIASAARSLTAVHAALKKEGFQPISLGQDVQGEAREVGPPATDARYVAALLAVAASAWSRAAS